MMFIDEMIKIHPVIFREIIKRQMKILSNKDIILPHLTILEYLKEKQSAKMSDIAKMLGITMGAVTGLIDKMTEHGLVKRERSEQDRRVVFVKILKKGMELYDQFNSAKREIMKDLFSVLTEKEKEEYLKLVNKIYKFIKEKNENI